MYDYYIRTAPGNDSYDKVKVQAEATKNVLCWCESLWCQYHTGLLAFYLNSKYIATVGCYTLFGIPIEYVRIPCERI